MSGGPRLVNWIRMLTDANNVVVLFTYTNVSSLLGFDCH